MCFLCFLRRSIETVGERGGDAGAFREPSGGFRIQDSGAFRVQDSGFRVQGFRVQDSGGFREREGGEGGFWRGSGS